MGGSKKAAGPEAPAREEFDVRGRHVVITRLNGREVVQVDGRVEGFYSTPDGYLLKRDVYRHPAKTLRAAVERYLEREVPAK